MSESPRWQPIETAPKDGTVVLLWDGRYVCAGLWEVILPNGQGWFVGSIHGESAEWSDCGLSPTVNATHWMPLPAPPKTEQDARTDQ